MVRLAVYLSSEAGLASSPICLLEWLRPHEYRETRVALSKFAAEVNLAHADVRIKDDARQALDSWLHTAAGNAQFCFIGAHGIASVRGTTIGIGASGKSGEYATWSELWNWFSQGELIGGLWLGACRTNEAAAALSPLLAGAVIPAIPYIYGFKDSIYPSEIEQILVKLIEFTALDSVVPLHEELDLLRAAVPGTAIELYYPAATHAGAEYVNVDQMPTRIGMTFRQLLERQTTVRA